MKSLDLETVRLFLHVLAATVWVGGQITLAALVPALRGTAEGVTKVAARAFNRIAWPAFAVLVVTGIWNVFSVDAADRTTSYDVTLFVKIVVVAASGLAAFGHARARSRTLIAVGGALGGLTAIAALFLGVMLHG